MSIIAPIISTNKEITQIRAFPNGVAKDIKSVWAFVNGSKKMIWPAKVLNLSGAQKYEEDTIWPAGRYRIQIRAGHSYRKRTTATGVVYRLVPGYGGYIEKDIVISQQFIIRAYCGSDGTESAAGTNPYSGFFKVNGQSTESAIGTVSHIFGNCGSVGGGETTKPSQKQRTPSSGNCLGNGAYTEYYEGVVGSSYFAQFSTGAGSCLHILPVGGTFGTNYLFAFHTTGGATGNQTISGGQTYWMTGGVGSAYGGAGSGATNNRTDYAFTTLAGGSTPYGTGGAGVSATSAPAPGKDGTGIGYGAGNFVGSVANLNGAGAWFDGTKWNDVRTTDHTSLNGAGGIVITYLGD